MSGALWFIVETAGSLLASACLLRAMAWRARLSSLDPLHRFAIAATDWIVKPFRRTLPQPRTSDWASLTAAAVITLATAVLWTLLFGAGLLLALPLAALWLAKWGLYLVMGLVLIQAVLSWVNPHAPVAPGIERLTQPLLAPVRRVVPLVGGVDLSPLVVIVAAQVLVALIESAFLSLIA